MDDRKYIAIQISCQPVLKVMTAGLSFNSPALDKRFKLHCSKVSLPQKSKLTGKCTTKYSSKLIPKLQNDPA